MVATRGWTGRTRRINAWSIWLSWSPDLVHWGESEPVINPMTYHWDQMKIGPGCDADKNRGRMAQYISRCLPHDGRFCLSARCGAARYCQPGDRAGCRRRLDIVTRRFLGVDRLCAQRCLQLRGHCRGRRYTQDLLGRCRHCHVRWHSQRSRTWFSYAATSRERHCDRVTNAQYTCRLSRDMADYISSRFPKNPNGHLPVAQ